jgi:dolichol-phosphate mannosyltransferase
MISVVIPLYDERENLAALDVQLQAVLPSAAGSDFEVIFVDDGSRDGSAEILDAMSRAETRYRVLHFSRNFGHQAALQAGLDAARGDAVILMDADLQDPPEIAASLIAKWREGFDVVYAVRKKRKENALKRFSYAAFYRTMRLIAAIDTPLDAGDFCLLDRRVVDTLVGLRERNRFLRGLRSWVGFRQASVEYERAARHAGRPKYTVRKLISLAVSGYVGFSSFPLRLAAWIGALAATAGFALGVWVITRHYTDPLTPRGWTSTSAIVLFVGGVQLVMLGVIGEYVGRIYDEVRRRPLYIVRSKSGFDGDE